jgi:hypothetical protein
MMRVFPLILALFVALFPPNLARAETEVDLALVLAVDVSRSMDADEQRLQRDGFVEAFLSPAVHEAIRKGVIGRIAVTYVEWSGVDQQRVVVPWMLVDGPERATAFSDRLSDSPRGVIFLTSISGAIDFGVRLFSQSEVDPLRRVIDISGDGPNNNGRTVTLARDDAVASGITINGLPFLLKRPSGRGEIENLDLYYLDCVIGGPGAFIVPVREAHHFADAIKTKLVREIAGMKEPEPLLKRAQERERSNCLTGEILRNQQRGP